MAVPLDKHELLDAIKNNYEKLCGELLSIPYDLTAVQTLEGHTKGTMMSINNLLAYLVGWGELVLKWNRKKDNNETVDFPERGFKWNELGKLAQKFYTDYQEEDFNTIFSKLENVVKAILLLVESKTNKDLYEVPWYGKWTLGRMIQFNTSSPYTNARGRICKWKRECKTKKP